MQVWFSNTTATPGRHQRPFSSETPTLGLLDAHWVGSTARVNARLRDHFGKLCTRSFEKGDIRIADYTITLFSY